MKKILGTVSKWAVPILMTALPAAMFYWEVMHYQAHFDSSLTGIVGIACVVGGIFLLTGAIEKKQKVNAAICGLAIASGLFFYYWSTRIPFCTKCEPMSKQDLGFMLEPFADRFGPYWGD